jgi:muconolactone delta-isomerase
MVVHRRIVMPTFTVLCRIDAFADYVAKVRAKDAARAAELAERNHGRYKWVPDQTAEFDARLYVTLDENGREIESTQVGDF